MKAEFMFHPNEIIPSSIDLYLVNTKYTAHSRFAIMVNIFFPIA